MSRLIDISPEIHEGIAVFPGDVAFSRNVSLDMKSGDHLTLSSLSGTLHLGAHADSPSHYLRDGQDIGSRSLEYYIGACDVVDLTRVGNRRITVDDVAIDRGWARRVLFRTDSFPDPSSWSDEFTSLSPELIDALAGRGVCLVGIDTPSIDPSDSKELESHQAVARNDMAILEGLVLQGVEPGRYELIAPPLKIRGGDAGPVRAVLRTIG